MSSDIGSVQRSAPQSPITPDEAISDVRSRGVLSGILRAPLLWLIVLGLILGFAFQGARGLWSPDEGRYVGAALQMLDSGNFLAPAYSPDELNFSKPPLTYWVIAASVDVFGRNTWAVRAPYAMAFVLTLCVLYATGRQVLPEKPWLPGLIYGTAVFPFFTSNIISTDVFLTLFEALAVCGFIYSIASSTESGRRHGLTLMWLGFGLAFLTKGPPGLLPLFAILIYAVSRDGRRGLRRLFTVLGIGTFLLVGLTWYVLAALRYPWLLHYFLHQEVYGRIFTAVHRRHPGAFAWAVIYLPVLILGSLPWWPALFRTMRASVSLENWRAWRRQHAMEPLLILWFIVPLVVFCLSQSRLPLYVLPLFVPLALLAALQLRHRVDLRIARQRLMLSLWLVALITAKGVAAYAIHPPEDNRQAAREIAAMAPGEGYAAVIIMVNTDAMYDIEEQVPWGLRLYLDKPVYGVAWRMPEGAAQLCSAVRAQPSSLLIIDHTIDFAASQRVLAGCHPATTSQLGSWRGKPLLRITN